MTQSYPIGPAIPVAGSQVNLGADGTFAAPPSGGGSPGGSSGQVQFNNGGAFGGLSTLTADGSGNLTLTARLINAFNAAASAPAKLFSGTWFTGGTSTTTKPHVLIEPAGTTSTNWNTAGTGLAVNAASGFGGDLAWFGVNGARSAGIDSTGRISVPLGTAVLPSIYPGTDTGTGIYSPGVGQFAISTGGVQRFLVTASGIPYFVGPGGNSIAFANGVSIEFSLNGLNYIAAKGGSNASIVFQTGGSSERLRITGAGILQIAEAGDIAVGTTTGTKFGTATNQRLAFFNATPIVQPASANQAALTNNTGGTADGTLAAVGNTSTADQAAVINDNFTELHRLQNEMRTALVNLGLIKGGA
jgi:hypothetical protein